MKILDYLGYAVLLWACMVLFANCSTCKPDKSVATIQPFLLTPGMVVKGFDGDCDGDIDYWQHYLNGHEVGRRTYVTD